MAEDLKSLMKSQYIAYASYVILERAIPHLVDGLKPVQRRILAALKKMHDGKFHKVANVAGQTMALHPHGDAPIVEALVHLANKGYLLEQQGNFGNPFTGDPAAAARYIETRLSPLAVETMFQEELTEFQPSYDGRAQEPCMLPAKLPLLLLQGADGIAVGMATHIFPHNFQEVLEAQIAALEEKPFLLLPDFPTGGVMDPHEYDEGRGKVMLRAKIEVKDAKTLVVTEICHGTTTESLIRSIDEAAKKGKIKIESIADYTAERVEVEIKLPRGHYAQELIDGLYAYTECQVSLSSQVIVIYNQRPLETTVPEIVRFHAHRLRDLLKQELLIEQRCLEKERYRRRLEEIFIVERIYRVLEDAPSSEEMVERIAQALRPFHQELGTAPGEEEIAHLLALPMRRISHFDRAANLRAMEQVSKRLEEITQLLGQMTKVTIRYLKAMIKQYGGSYSRKTVLGEFHKVDRRVLEEKKVVVGFDAASGFLGTKVEGNCSLSCSNFDKILLFLEGGKYRVIALPEKQYVHKDGAKVLSIAVADKTTQYVAIYRDPNTQFVYGKRFVVDRFIVDKEYPYLEEGMKLEALLPSPGGGCVELIFLPKVRQKVSRHEAPLSAISLKGVSARGVRLAPRPVKKVRLMLEKNG